MGQQGIYNIIQTCVSSAPSPTFQAWSTSSQFWFLCYRWWWWMCVCGGGGGGRRGGVRGGGAYAASQTIMPHMKRLVHWVHSEYLKTEHRLKTSARESMHTRKPHCCIWRDLLKPSLRFSFFCVSFVSKGRLLDFYWTICADISSYFRRQYMDVPFSRNEKKKKRKEMKILGKYCSIQNCIFSSHFNTEYMIWSQIVRLTSWIHTLVWFYKRTPMPQ